MRYTVRVKTGSSREKVEAVGDRELAVWVRAKPVDGQANEAVIRILAEHWNAAKSRIRIRSGLTSKIKIVDCLD